MKQFSHLNFDVFDTVVQLGICAHVWSHLHCYLSLESDVRLSSTWNTSAVEREINV